MLLGSFHIDMVKRAKLPNNGYKMVAKWNVVRQHQLSPFLAHFVSSDTETQLELPPGVKPASYIPLNELRIGGALATFGLASLILMVIQLFLRLWLLLLLRSSFDNAHGDEQRKCDETTHDEDDERKEIVSEQVKDETYSRRGRQYQPTDEFGSVRQW